MEATELVGKWVHRTTRAVKGDGSYMSAPVFVLKVDNGIYYISDISGASVRFLPLEWLDGSWALWPVKLETPKAALSKGDSMNFKKRSEMCKPEVKEQEVCSVLIGDIAEGTVFSGKPKGYGAGVFLKLGRDVHYNPSPGAVRLTYADGGGIPCGFIFENERGIQGYKVLNVTLVDEDA